MANQRQHDTPVNTEFGGAVNASSIQQVIGDTVHGLPHHKDTEGENHKGQNHAPVGVDHWNTKQILDADQHFE